jgi:hypothetical protein
MTNTRNVRNLLSWSLALLLIASLALIETSARVNGEGWAAGYAGRHGAVVNGEECCGEEGGGEEGYGEGGEGYLAATPVGAILARPPAAATALVIDGTTYWRYRNTYYARADSGGDVAYRVVAPPR